MFHDTFLNNRNPLECSWPMYTQPNLIHMIYVSHLRSQELLISKSTIDILCFLTINGELLNTPDFWKHRMLPAHMMLVSPSYKDNGSTINGPYLIPLVQMTGSDVLSRNLSTAKSCARTTSISLICLHLAHGHSDGP